jgi:hypothetical protein
MSLFRKNLSRPSRPPATRRRLEVETLEDRLVPALGATPFAVNPPPAGFLQGGSATAVAPGGNRSVIVYAGGDFATEVGGFNPKILAQVYSGLNVRVGGEITVASDVGSRFVDSAPAVAMDPAGDFVVVWDHLRASDFSGDVMAQRFSANGAPVGGPIVVQQVSDVLSAGPTVAMDGRGDFVVAYANEGGDGSRHFEATVFNAQGALSQFFTLPEGRHRILESDQVSVAEAPDGRFAIAFVQNSQVRLDRFSAAGDEISSDLLDPGVPGQDSPRVAVDANFNCVVAWQGPGAHIFAERVSSADVVGGVLDIGPGTAPSIAMDFSGPSPDTGGNFVVAYEQADRGRVVVTEVTNRDTVFRNQVVSATDPAHTTLTEPSISINANHEYVVSFTEVRTDAVAQSITAQTGVLLDESSIDLLGPYVSPYGAGGSPYASYQNPLPAHLLTAPRPPAAQPSRPSVH